tara:strand:- start:44 stop:517 length:474 start_codon:yes stop_codon:yes gene_type:complete
MEKKMKTNKKIKRVLVEEDILNQPKYLEVFEYQGFVYGLQIHFKGRGIYEGGRMVGMSNPYITLTKYEIKTYIHERYDFRQPLETFDLDIPQEYSWSEIPSFVRKKLQNDFVKEKYNEWLNVSKLSETERMRFLSTLNKSEVDALIKYGKQLEVSNA